MPTPAPPAHPLRRGCLIAACIAAGLAGVLGAVIAVGALSYRGLAPRDELTAAERSLLVQVDDLVDFGIVPRRGPYRETAKAKRNIDGSLELEYEYQSEADGTGFILRSEAEINRSRKAASSAFRARCSAYRVGVRLTGGPGTRLVEQARVPRLGEDCYVAQMNVGGKPAGNTVVIRRGRTVFSVQLSGLYIDTAADWEALLGPHLANEGKVTCR